MLSFIPKVLRALGVLREHNHHVEADFTAAVNRFKAIAERDAQRAWNAAQRIGHLQNLKGDLEASVAKAERNAKKLETFFEA